VITLTPNLVIKGTSCQQLLRYRPEDLARNAWPGRIDDQLASG